MISMISSVGRNRELGKNNNLIWHFKEDMKFFKEQTLGKPVIMGMKTLESLPKILPNRQNIVLTRRNVELDDRMIKIFIGIFCFLAIFSCNNNDNISTAQVNSITTTTIDDGMTPRTAVCSRRKEA